MFVAASTRCFGDRPFAEACAVLTDLEFDRIELWMSERHEHLRPSEVAADPERFVARYRETTRLAAAAVCLEDDVDPETFGGVVKLAKMLRVTQVTVPSSPLGTPFNAEIDRLRDLLLVAGRDGVRLSIKTQTGRLSEDPHTAVELCQAVRGLGLTLDPAHYLGGPNQGKPFDHVFPYVHHVHLRDATPGQLQVQVGLGEIDYSRLIAQLKRESYNRSLSIEFLPELSAELDRGLELRKLRMLLETLL